jgi:TRAP-type transport system small permease protein
MSKALSRDLGEGKAGLGPMQKVLEMLVAVEKATSVLLLLAVLGLVFAQVIARYVFKAPFFWSDELARYSYVWLSFVAAIFVTAERSHIEIDLLGRVLGPRGNRIVAIAASGLVIVTCLVMVVGSWDWLMTTVRPKSPALRMPMVGLYGVVVFAFGLMAFHKAVELVAVLAGKELPRSQPAFE